MRTDIYNWLPISVTEIHEIFSNIPVTWCIAGGWALDLFLGHQTRKHADIDVVLLREEQRTAFDYLCKDWQLYKARNGTLELWEEGELLTETKDIWVSKDRNSPWAFQIMLIETIQGSWVYGREKSVHRPLADIIASTQEGIPYLKPEIQLLYKGGGAEIRDKDHGDFQTVFPHLTSQAKEWLKASLQRQFPHRHEWVDDIKKKEQ
ncbi:hypothetical protein [Paenibacillus sp. MSJ-34]|uniref:nucleotidyltransferase domain-containing protein n=1 Tax=Paenibacillus sp. MSJ-34 TaxID=2841529 RepID=UPI001C11B1DB|nr:hypothetical protein [Paenibacillus sp. MSJ-34]MBU5442202.1 hypothetical protein [Paenibacillus sp. MSJ-34]